MRRLHEAASSNADARLAIEMFCYSVRKQIAAMIAVLGGVDMLVFTGGIGENDGEVRAAICAGLAWTGLRLDRAQNLAAANAIDDPASRSGCASCPRRKTSKSPAIPGHSIHQNGWPWNFLNGSMIFKRERDIAHAGIPGIRLDVESQFPAHFQHHGIFLKNLAIYAAQSLGILHTR